MAIQPVPYIDPAPVPGPQRGDESTFDDRMDAKILWDEIAPGQFGNLADNVVHNAGEALSSATSAAASAVSSSNFADASHTSAIAAASSASDSAASASNSQTSATAAANSAAAAASSLKGTSTTSNVIGPGTLTFTTQSGKQFPFGVDMKAVDQSNANNAVYGTVASYSGTTLVLTVTSYTGSGTITAWNLAVVGQQGTQGPPGGVAGGSLTGALNLAKGADVASAGTPDIWSGNGNYEVITGTATITGFTGAPQAGANRRILAGAAFTLTAGANMIIKGIGSGLSYTVAPGDEIDVYAETTTKFRISVTKGDGTAMAALYGAFQNVRLLTGAGTYVAKKTGWHRITLSGGCARAGLAVGSNARATGSSAAGFCVGMVFLVAGQSYSYAQGAGASSGSVALGSGALNGVNGGASSFFGTGIPTLTANGGVAGVASVGSTSALTGPPGGTASGGHLNVQGGKAGDVSGTTTGGVHASGGGAVGVMGVGYGSGDVVCNSGASSTASGGAGIGGASGSATRTSIGSAASSGGGFGGPSGSVTNSVATTGSPSFDGTDQGGAQNTVVGYVPQLMNATAGGSIPDSAGVGNRDGAGSGACVATASAATNSGGVFAGSGATVYNGDISNSGQIGGFPGQYGGGQGGVAVGANSAGATTIKGGQPGLVQIES